MSERRSVTPFGMGDLKGNRTWQAQEHKIAEKCKGRRVPGSGSSSYARGDVKSSRYLYECKQTKNDSYRVTWAVLRKISQQALAAGKIPALAFEVRCQESRDVVAETEWVAVPLSEWQRLLESDIE